MSHRDEPSRGTIVPRMGLEYIVDAHGCDPVRLASRDELACLTDTIVRDLDLHICQTPQWHVFDGAGGVTGLILLSESHLTVHSFPEYGYAAFNLYHCRARGAWPWEQRLADVLGATDVVVRTQTRGQTR